MSLSFRQIGARNKLQGGTSFTNLAVTKQFSTLNPMIITGNTALVESVGFYLQDKPIFLQNLEQPIENIVTNESLDIEHIAELVQPDVVSQILSDNSYVNTVATTLEPVFVPTTTNQLIANSVFMNAISEDLIPLGESLIFNDTLQTQIQAEMVNNILTTPLIHNIIDNVLPYIYNSYFFTGILNNFFNSSNAQFLKIPNIYNNVTYKITSITIEPNTFFEIKILPTLVECSVGTLSSIAIALRDSSTKTLMKTLYSETFAPPVTTLTIEKTNSFTNVTTSSMSAEIVLICEVTNNASCDGFVQLTLLPINYIFELLTDSASIALPINISSSLTKVYDYKNNQIMSGVQLDYGVVQYSNGYPIWQLNIENCLNLYLATSTDFSNYVASNINGPVKLYTPSLVTNVYNGQEPIMVVKLDNSKIVKWVANLYATGSFKAILNGISSDSNDNVYVYGVHYGDSLIAYNSDGTAYTTVISTTSFTNLRGNGFVVKYSPLGVVLGFARISSIYKQNILNVQVHPTNDFVTLSCSSNTQNTVVVRNFLGTETTLPVYAQGFFVRLNNVGFAEPEIILCVAPVLAVLPVPPAVTSGTAVCLDSVTINTSTMSLFKVFNAASACVFAVIDNVTSLFQYNYTAIGKTVILFVHYKDDAPTIQEFATLECNNFVDDGRQQLLNQVFIARTYMALRIQSTLTITFQSVATTLALPPGATDVNVVLIYNSDLYTFDVLCMISNSSVEKMYFFVTQLYITFTFYGVSTVYNFDQSIAFTVGAFGKTGKAIIQYDLSTLQFILLGYYTTNS